MQERETASERLWTGYTGRLSTLLAFGWGAILLDREAVPPLLPNIVDALSMSQTQAGIALSVMWVVYATFQYPGGRFSDKLSRTTVIVVGLVVAISGFVLLSLVTTFTTFLVASAAVGVGAGIYFPATRGFLSDLFRERRGQAIGIQVAAGSVGSMLAAGVAIVVLSVATWRTAFVPSVVLLSVIVVHIHTVSREEYTLTQSDLTDMDFGL